MSLLMTAGHLVGTTPPCHVKPVVPLQAHQEVSSPLSKAACINIIFAHAFIAWMHYPSKSAAAPAGPLAAQSGSARSRSGQHGSGPSAQRPRRHPSYSADFSPYLAAREVASSLLLALSP